MCGLFRDKSRCERRYVGGYNFIRWVCRSMGGVWENSRSKSKARKNGRGRVRRAESIVVWRRTGTALRASVSQPGEMEIKFLPTPRTCVAQGKYVVAAGWLRTGFLPWIGERRSPIRQRKGVLENYQRAETTPHHAYTSILAICIKEIVSECPKVAFHHALHSQRNKKRSSSRTTI
jgi:hypothetical protein